MEGFVGVCAMKQIVIQNVQLIELSISIAPKFEMTSNIFCRSQFYFFDVHFTDYLPDSDP